MGYDHDMDPGHGEPGHIHDEMWTKNNMRGDHSNDTVVRTDDAYDTALTSDGTAVENEEGGGEALGAGAGALGGAAVGMAVGGPPGAVIYGFPPITLSRSLDTSVNVVWGYSSQVPASYGVLVWNSPSTSTRRASQTCPLPGPGERPIPRVTGPPLGPPVPPPVTQSPHQQPPLAPAVPAPVTLGPTG